MIPIAVLVLSGLGLQLNDIAQKASGKTISFADNAGEAVDCALLGIAIEECSPDLLEVAFEDDLREFEEFNRDFAENLSDSQSKIHLILEKGESFKASHNKEFVIRIDDIDVDNEMIELIVVDLSDVTSVMRIPFGFGEELKLDVSDDGFSDIILHISALDTTSVDLSVEIIHGEVTPLDISVLLLLLTTGVLFYVFYTEKDGD